MGVAQQPVAGSHQCSGLGCQAEKGLAREGVGRGHGDIADGGKPMFGGEA